MGKRKRTGLSLHRVKRRHGDAVNKSTIHTARFTPSHIYSANCTPLRLTPVSTPVKQYERVITPLSSVKKKKNPRITSTPEKIIIRLYWMKRFFMTRSHKKLLRNKSVS